MATPSRPPTSPPRDTESRPPSFLQSALGLLRGTPRPAREAGPTIRVMFAASRPADAPAADAPPAHDDPVAMRRALKAELNRVRGSRHVLRHLAKVEHDLKTHGLELFDRLPWRVLQTALAQLDSLVEPPAAPGIAALRSRLAVAILAQERVERPPATATRPSAPSPSRTSGTARLRAGMAAPAGRLQADDPRPASPPAPGPRHATPARASTVGGWSNWGGDGHVEVRESSFADFERASTEWQLLDEPRKP